ncbi:MAG: hypothetical protein KAY37_08870 [Phycisphaerae bacterium]|nr:hypothetical protein [Phycisphaerae bacterium]
MAAQPVRLVIPSGESTEIHVQYDTHGKQGDQEAKVIISSNDPRRLYHDTRYKEGEAVFKVKGFVKRAITRTPLGGLVIKSTDTKPGQAGTVRLENQMSEPLKLKLKSSSLREMDVEIKEITPGLVYDVVGRTNREIKPGTIRGELVFTTRLTREPEFTVHVRIKIMWNVESSPPVLFFRKDNDKPMQRAVKLQYYGSESPLSFQVTGTECTCKDISVQVGKTLPPLPWMKKMTPPIRAYVDVKVSLPPPSQLPPEGAVITFTTNDPQRPKIEVLVTTDKAAFEAKMYSPPAK